MRALKLSQRLLGCGPLLPVWLDGVTKFGQRGLGGQGQTRGIAAGFPCQQFGDRIGPWGRTPRLSAGRAGGRAAEDCAGGAMSSVLVGF